MNGVIDVSLGGEMYHRVDVGHCVIDSRLVADIALDKFNPGRLEPLQVLGIAGIRQVIEYRNVPVRPLAVDVPYEVGTDKARPACNQNFIHINCFILQ
jgi:hypothetical protein